MSTFIPFNPAYTSGQTKTSAALAASFSVAAGTNQVCITNTGSYIAYVRIGVGSFSATTADYPVLAGSQVVLTKAQATLLDKKYKSDIPENEIDRLKVMDYQI